MCFSDIVILQYNRSIQEKGQLPVLKEQAQEDKEGPATEYPPRMWKKKSKETATNACSVTVL